MAGKTFSQLFTEARNAGKGLFEYKGKQYATLKKGEDEAEFRRNHADYDQFMGTLGHTDSSYWNNENKTYGGWNNADWGATNHAVNGVPEPTTEPIIQPVPKMPKEGLISPVPQEVPSPATPVTYNRTQVRAKMYDAGLNPYSFTGAQRRALRYYLNGDTSGKNYDSNLLKGTKIAQAMNLRFQQGGQINMNEQQLQQAFIQFLAQKTGAKTQQELEAAIQQLGEEGLKQAYAEFMQAMQQQVQAAKKGAKINYIKYLRGQCPDGYEMQYYKAGGQLCKKCMKKVEMQDGGNMPEDPVEAYKCGRKLKKDQNGNKVTLKREVKKGNTTTRHWSDGTTSKVEEDEEAMPRFTGRDGKSYTSQEYPRTRAQRQEDAKADSLYRADWRSKTAPKLQKRK